MLILNLLITAQLELIPLRRTSGAVLLTPASCSVLKKWQKWEPNESSIGAHPSQTHLWGSFANSSLMSGSQKVAKVRTQLKTISLGPLSEVLLALLWHYQPHVRFSKSGKNENPTSGQQGATPIRSTSRVVLLNQPLLGFPKTAKSENPTEVSLLSDPFQYYYHDQFWSKVTHQVIGVI